MYFLALATDYDGTLAADGRVDLPTLAALEELKRSGRKLILVSGREREDLERVFPQADLFDLLVLENGALLVDPNSGEEMVLTDRPPPAFVERLRDRGVTPLSVGRGIVATWEPNETTVLEAIRDLGLELQITFNKGAVMVLPAGVNKASGLSAALARLGLSPHNVVGVGDAENDHAMLRLCGAGVAVANALPAVKESADLLTEGARGHGVIELIERLLADDLISVAGLYQRHAIAIGVDQTGGEPVIGPRDCALVAGVSGGGKSTLVTAVLERLTERGFQYCVIDPEGDYEELAAAVQLGDAHMAPSLDAVDDVLATADRNLVVSLLALDMSERPGFFGQLLPKLLALRARTGRPHWIIVDEAHHMLPTNWAPTPVTLPDELRACLFVTVHPSEMAPAALARVGTVIVIGGDPAGTLSSFAAATGDDPPDHLPVEPLGTEEALVWRRADGRGVSRITKHRPHQRMRRHLRKYSQGELGQDSSFYFRGADGKLNLRAYNLSLFTQLANGVDDDTWMHHLRTGDYSRWLRDCIKDDQLADVVAAVERTEAADPRASRHAICEAIKTRYIAPASA